MTGIRSWLPLQPRAAMLAAALVVLADCKTMAGSAFNGAASEIVNLNCSIERLFTREPICSDLQDQDPPPVVPTVFCFRDLGGVICYSEPGEMEDAIRRDGDQRVPLGS